VIVAVAVRAAVAAAGRREPRPGGAPRCLFGKSGPCLGGGPPHFATLQTDWRPLHGGGRQPDRWCFGVAEGDAGTGLTLRRWVCGQASDSGQPPWIGVVFDPEREEGVKSGCRRVCAYEPGVGRAPGKTLTRSFHGERRFLATGYHKSFRRSEPLITRIMRVPPSLAPPCLV